jgi:competence ComEA-like helix-hairpin-helix protein
MAFTEELIERLSGGTGAGLGAGLAALLLAPRLVRPLGRGLRSLAKGAIKGYLVVAERTRAAVAEAGDELQQLYTEVQAEAGALAAGQNGHDAQAAMDLRGERREGETEERVDGAKPEGPSSRAVAPPPPAARASSPEASPAPRKTKSGRVNLNTADKEALMSLPGVGEKTADKILQYRQERGHIGSVDELHEAEILFAHTTENLRDRVST